MTVLSYWVATLRKFLICPAICLTILRHLGLVEQPYRMIRDGKQATDGRGRALPDKTKGGPERICRGCCNEFWLDPKLQISIIEFASGNAAKCWHRGKLMNDFTVQPFFENVIRFSEEIERGKAASHA